jgi:hypothetical protein
MKMVVIIEGERVTRQWLCLCVLTSVDRSDNESMNIKQNFLPTASCVELIFIMAAAAAAAAVVVI